MINFSNFSKLSLLMIMILISGAFQTASAFDAKSFSLGFGPGEDKLMYYNSKIKDYEEPYPSGPSAFCIVKGNTVSVLDTFNNSLKQFDEKGKLIGVLNIFEIAKKELRSSEISLACVSARNNEKGETEYAVSDRVNGKIYIISAGKLVKTILNPDNKHFGQIEEVAYDTDGSIAACDWAVNKIYVFDKTGKAVCELPSQLNGMYLSSGILYYIEKDKDGKLSFIKFEVKSKKSEKLFDMDLPAARNVKLIGVDAKGNFMMAFFDDSIQEKLVNKDPANAPMGYFTVAMVSAAGKMGASINVRLTTAFGTQFFFDRAEEAVYYQDYNAELAPAGSYTLKKVNFGGK